MEDQVEDEMFVRITQLTSEINWYMRERGLTRADLAARMGVSRGRVSQILGGGEDLTLRALAALATALDARFDIDLTMVENGDAYALPAQEARAAIHRPLSRSRHRDNPQR